MLVDDSLPSLRNEAVAEETETRSIVLSRRLRGDQRDAIDGARSGGVLLRRQSFSSRDRIEK